MAKARIAINGFGRIGRAFFRAGFDDSRFEIVAINDLGNLEQLAYLLKYDTAYGRMPFEVEAKEGALMVNGKSVAFESERDATKLPWGSLGIDIVVESTGVFTSYEKSKVHLGAGAKRVVISAPVKDDPAAAGVSGATVLMCVNEGALKDAQITSNASCTTNATSPVIGILKKGIGIEKAILTTVHGYTASQSLIDGPSKKDLREGRAAAQNIVPTSTGAAIATTKAHTELEGKFDGISMRVPIIVGSIVDITFVASRSTSVEEVNNILKDAATSFEWKSVFAVTDEPIVSSDIIGAPFGSIADLSLTRVIDGDLVKVCAWYDNEAGYTHTLIEHVAKVSSFFGGETGA